MLKVGDIITSKEGNKSKVLAVTGDVVCVSVEGDYNVLWSWLTEKQLIAWGYTFPKDSWVPKDNEYYWFINSMIEVGHGCNTSDFDTAKITHNNYFRTREEAKSAALKVKELLNKLK